MKKYIDYLFWKRSWFRLCFILFPTLPLGMIIFLMHLGMTQETAKDFGMGMFIVLLLIALIDNENVDHPENPFKKQSE